MVKFTDNELRALRLALIGEAINSDVLRVITHKSKEWIAEAEADVE